MSDDSNILDPAEVQEAIADAVREERARLRKEVEKLRNQNKDIPIHPQGDEGYEAALNAVLAILSRGEK